MLRLQLFSILYLLFHYSLFNRMLLVNSLVFVIFNTEFVFTQWPAIVLFSLIKPV
jgi:hypothetical protein